MNETHVAEAATIEGDNVYLTEEQIIESDGALGVLTAFRYAAHDWMNDNLPDDVHTAEVCDRFNWEAERFTGMSRDGAMHLAIDDAKGETWHFFGTAPHGSKILPIQDED